MKKFFALIAFFIVLAFAFNNASATLSSDDGTNWFEVYVHVPIIVTPLDMNPDPGITARLLPNIAPGTTVNYPNPDLVDIQFSVEGGFGADYNVDGDVVHTIETDPGDPTSHLTLNGLIWSADLNVAFPGYYGSADLGDPGSTFGDFTGWGPPTLTFGPAGRDIFRVYPTSMTAGPNAVSGVYSFAVTLTAYYI